MGSIHCVKSVQILSFSGPYFPVFELNTKIYEIWDTGKYGLEKTPYLDTWHSDRIMSKKTFSFLGCLIGF